MTLSSSRAATRVLALATLAACASPRESPPIEQAALGGDVVARVGDVVISRALVAGVAAARSVSAREAATLLIDDALAAQGAIARGLDRVPSVSWAIQSLQARTVADRLRERARADGPPSDAEVEELTAAHWREVDMPEAIRVVHAVARRAPGATPAQLARARAVATDLARATAAAVSPEDFEARARAVPHEGVEVNVERLPSFVSDGRIVEGDGAMDATFVAAAFALADAGSTSGIVESTFGWHVIRLVEKIHARYVPFEQRRQAFADEVFAMRARGALEALLATRKSSARVELAPAAEQLMTEVTSVAAP